MEKKEKTPQALTKLINYMQACDDVTLSAAFAMLPDLRPNGSAILIAATARVVAENFNPENEDMFFNNLRQAIHNTRKVLEEAK